MKRRRSVPVYSQKCQRLGKYLLPLLDPYAWGFTASDGQVRRACEKARLEAYYNGLTYPPQKMTKTLIQARLDEREAIHYNSNRKSGFALLRAEFDAHDGQQDLFECIQWFRRYFPCAYDEPSTRYRGWAFYLLVHVGLIKRCRFNELCQRVERAVGVLLKQHGLTCTFEIGGLFTTTTPVVVDPELGKRTYEVQFGKLGCLPRCRTDADVQRLTSSPIYHVAHLDSLLREAEVTLVCDLELEPDDAQLGGCLPPRNGRLRKRVNPTPVTEDAFWRMNVVAFDFSLLHGRLPNVEELLAAYEDRFGGATDGDRIRRAVDALKCRSAKFDPHLVAFGGYDLYRHELLEAVRQHAVDRACNYKNRITDEDLAIALYTVQVGSFSIHGNPRQQFTVSNPSIMKMFHALKSLGLTKAGCNRNKAVALKRILQQNGLITCEDEDYVHTGASGGVGKKYVVGPNHPRFGDFEKWREESGVRVLHVRELRQMAVESRNCDPEDVVRVFCSDLGDLLLDGCVSRMTNTHADAPQSSGLCPIAGR